MGVVSSLLKFLKPARVLLFCIFGILLGLCFLKKFSEVGISLLVLRRTSMEWGRLISVSVDRIDDAESLA